MLKPYRTIQDVLASRWVLSPPAERHRKTDRVLRSTKLESSIYHDLRTEDAAMDEIEQDAGKKLKSFPALSQDVFQSFYSLVPRRNEEISLSVAARKFNAPILEHMTKSEEYPTLKAGNFLPMKRHQSSFPRYPENWTICSRSLLESKGHFIRWKSSNNQKIRL